MRKVLPFFFCALLFACSREELIQEVNDPEPIYRMLREAFARKSDSISHLRCLGELVFDGGVRVYVTLEQDSTTGAAHFYSPTRQELGWVRFGSGSPIWSFEDVPQLGGLAESGLFTGLATVGHPLLPEHFEDLKIGESRKSYYVRLVHRNLTYGYTILKQPLALLTLTLREEESAIEVHFRNHRRKDSFLFPYRLIGSTSFGDFELTYLEIRYTAHPSP